MLEVFPEFHTYLPHKIGGTTTVNQHSFVETLMQLPMLSDFMRNELFVKNQLYGNEELYQEAKYTHKISFSTLGRRFMFRFLTNYDRQDDFTVDQSQMMRVAKGNIHGIYERVKSEQGEDEEISICPL